MSERFVPTFVACSRKSTIGLGEHREIVRAYSLEKGTAAKKAGG